MTQGMLRSACALLIAGLVAISQPAAAAAQPAVMLETLSDRMIETLQQERSSLDERPERLFQLVEDVLVPHVDVETMARMVLGAHWRRASAGQRERFTKEFKTLLVRFYVSALLDDPEQLNRLIDKGDALITFQPGQVDAKGERARVRAEVHPPNGPPVPVTFSLYRKADEWLVYDVNVDGISIVINYRSSFGSQISRNGLDSLISELAQRNATLWEKTINGGSTADR